ncbi:MAG: hypothetical protein ACOX6S_08520 [Clostridia bacterium]
MFAFVLILLSGVGILCMVLYRKRRLQA